MVGSGSGGSAVTDMLVRAGARQLYLIDPDKLDTKNLARHVLTDRYVGLHKSKALAMHLKGIDPSLNIGVQTEKFDGFPHEVDLVVCGADSDLCCHLVNDYCLRHGIPAVYGGVHGAAETAEIITVIPDKTPCYACYEREGPPPEPTQEKYTNPNYDPTKAHHHEGLWGDVLMAASLQFQAILGILGLRSQFASLVLADLRYPFKVECVEQQAGCAVCTEDFSKLTV